MDQRSYIYGYLAIFTLFLQLTVKASALAYRGSRTAGAKQHQEGGLHSSFHSSLNLPLS